MKHQQPDFPSNISRRRMLVTVASVIVVATLGVVFWPRQQRASDPPTSAVIAVPPPVASPETIATNPHPLPEATTEQPESEDPAAVRERVLAWEERLSAIQAKGIAVAPVEPARRMLRAWTEFIADLPRSRELDDLRRRAEAFRLELAWADERSRAERPPWARRWDCDDFGPWAEAEADGYLQRFRFCPGDRFAMGSAHGSTGHRADERVHVVSLSNGFWIADTETTRGQWYAVMRLPGDPSDLPATGLGWDDARDFCARLGDRLRAKARLPTEAEWECACRAGHDLDASMLAGYAWTNRNTRSLMPVTGASRWPNSWGVSGMHGNALEWCLDTYAEYPPTEAVDPLQASGKDRVCRGGAYDLPLEDARAAARFHLAAESRLENLGMRVLIPDAAARTP